MHLLDRADSALLIIDLQPNFYPSRRRDVDRSVLTRVSDNATWLAAVAAALDVPTIVTEEDPVRNGPTHLSVLSALGQGSQVLEKTSFGVAGQAEVLSALEEAGKRTVIITGGETDICVSHSALGLKLLGYRVVVVSDAVFSPGVAHEHGLRRLGSCGVELLSAKQVFYDWLPQLDAVRAFRASYPELAEPIHFNL
ncbi:isochorismatase family protein [Saxibacter everestensis]|uniref:Isochorismatase family protein n=1 Tax=Saxibacter everestensis TaxID=2909229 RepID=A0ABY8QT81_9MICO|nr:isochorismatase family protein [Brevibacteriaceae bacterium ZFBP1038]